MISTDVRIIFYQIKTVVVDSPCLGNTNTSRSRGLEPAMGLMTIYTHAATAPLDQLRLDASRPPGASDACPEPWVGTIDATFSQEDQSKAHLFETHPTLPAGLQPDPPEKPSRDPSVPSPGTVAKMACR